MLFRIKAFDMSFFKKTGLLFYLFLVSNAVFSQVTDTIDIPSKVMKVTTDKFPITRVLNIEYGQTMPYNYSSKLKGVKLPEGKVNSFHQFRASANVNFIKKSKWMLSTTMNYRYYSTDINNPNWLSGDLVNRKEDFHYHFTSLNFTYFSKLFDKMVIYSGSVSVDGSQHHFERIRGMATATLLLKATSKTKMTFGLVVLIDPNIPVPAFISFSYEHKFNNGWTADVILPKGVFMRKNILKEGRISIGSEFDTTTFYLYNIDNTGKTYSFSQMEINSGLIYEHHLGGSFIATCKTGIKTVPMSRISDKNKSTNHYIFKTLPNPSFYFNVGISFNPFN